MDKHLQDRFGCNFFIVSARIGTTHDQLIALPGLPLV